MTTAGWDLDALVIGAGFAGLYALHRLRERGLRVRAYDAAGDVGGTWWWHAYPGAHSDTEGYVHQYLALADLVDGWGWSERFPAGYEVQRWSRFVADRLDLRRDIVLGTRVESAHWHDDHWTVRTDGGETVTARFVVSCAGFLDAREPIDVDAFAGTLVRTSHWSEKGPDVRGRRVGVIGTGPAGVQLVPAIADDVARLAVVATETPYVLPMTNTLYGWRERDAYRARRAELAETVLRTASGAEHHPRTRGADLAPDERHEAIDDAYRDGSRRLWLGTFADLTREPEVADAVTAYVRDRMRARLDDPRAADLLVPADHGFGERRVALDRGYLEAVGHDDVTLLAASDVARVRAEGLERRDGTVVELDVLAVADAFDAGPPALTRIDVRGRDGRALAHERVWCSTLGLAKHGYPNLFFTAMPFVPSATVATVRALQVDWIADLVAGGAAVLEATAASEQAWFDHHAELVRRERVTTPVSVRAYRAHCADEAALGHPSFTRT